MSLGSFGGGGITCRSERVRFHQVQHNLVLIREAECIFQLLLSQDHSPAPFVSPEKPDLSGLLTSITRKNNWIQPKQKTEPCYGSKPPASFRGDCDICPVCF